MNYISLCSGVEAASVAWIPLGWRPLAFAEIDPFCCAVLSHHFPEVPNLGDITKLNGADLERPDVLIAGTPCQPFSVAGQQLGLSDPRSTATTHFFRLVGEVQPRWVVWENVPGILSAGGGSVFRQILAAMDEFGYGVAWRVLDAQYFGVPQRRRRVFLVGYRGDWRPAFEVLLDPESGTWNPRAGPSSETPDSGADTKGLGTGGGGRVIAACRVAGTVASKWHKGYGGPSGDECQNLVVVDGRVRRFTPRECERLQGLPDDWTLVPWRGRPASDTQRYKAIGNSMAVPVVRWIGRRISLLDLRTPDDERQSNL